MSIIPARIATLSMTLICMLSFPGCSNDLDIAGEPFSKPVSNALGKIGLNNSSLMLPKLGGEEVSKTGRLATVNVMMNRPLSMIALPPRLWKTNPTESQAIYISRILGELGINLDLFNMAGAFKKYSTSTQTSIESSRLIEGKNFEFPSKLKASEPLSRVVQLLLDEVVVVKQIYSEARVQIATDKLLEIQSSLKQIITSTDLVPSKRWPVDAEYHPVGEQVNIHALAAGLVKLLQVIERSLTILDDIDEDLPDLEWETPFGNILIAGRGNNNHSGNYFLLIDLGGDDHYQDVGSPLGYGDVSIVIDMEGDDTIQWESTPGPGSGILGDGIWVDVSGDDLYSGRNMGLGVGVFGGGLFWDLSGDDVYKGGSMVQGAGEYGIGIFIDESGIDKYEAEFSGQGFGGPGGIGILLDHTGDDSYFCGGSIPDQEVERKKRHRDEHYLSRCQGYAFGIRPNVSGGIGVLVDQDGDDHYMADLFAQGSSYWFGLGMFIDMRGNDRYEAFEHCQGESLHLGAGFLGDWGGEDKYVGSEHCQGVGIDRAVGLLYDHAGDDIYQSEFESQGAGLKPYGVGLLIDRLGNDMYSAKLDSQGYSARPSDPFPEEQWPVGVLLDLEGKDFFYQPGVPDVSKHGRIQNRQGIAITGGR